MQHAVEQQDVSVLMVDGVEAVDEDVVGLVCVIDRELAVVHVGAYHLEPALGGEVPGVEGIVVVAAVDDAVVDDDAFDAVQLGAVGEGVPGGVVDNALGNECVQIGLDGLVGGRKDGVVASGREELAQVGSRNAADGLLAQQAVVFAILLKLLQVAGHGIVGKDIAGGGVDLLGTTTIQE